MSFELTVKDSDPTPPFEQIRKQLAHAIETKLLDAGTKLAPVRQLAGDLGVAPGTVARAYRELEASGHVETRRGGGTRVSPSAPRSGTQIFDDTANFQLAVAAALDPHQSANVDWTEQRRRQLISVSAVAVVSGKVLLLSPSTTANDRTRVWRLPSAELQWGEAPEKAALRVFAQVTGLEASMAEVLDVSSEINEDNGSKLHRMRITYRVAISHSPEATAAGEWVALADVTALDMENHAQRALAKIPSAR